jgi:hypothetical protein
LRLSLYTNELPTVSSHATARLDGISDVVPSDDGTPKRWTLEQNYPNPLNPTTTLAFDVPNSSFVILKVFDLLGREVTRLVNEELKPGRRELRFDASRFPTGIYLARLQAGGFAKTRTLMLLR